MGEYIFADVENEIIRLGKSHKLWEKGFCDLWQRGGIKAGSRVLDAGCGPGFEAIELAKIVGERGRVVGFDLTPEYLQYFKKRLEDETELANRAEAVEGRLGEKLPFSDASFDFVFAKYVLILLPDLVPVVEEFARVLTPRGKILVTDFNSYWQFSPLTPIVSEVMNKSNEAYADAGGNIGVGHVLPTVCVDAGFRIESITPEIRIGMPRSDIWNWVERFYRGYLPKLVKKGVIDQQKHDAFWEELAELADNSAAYAISSVFLHTVYSK